MERTLEASTRLRAPIERAREVMVADPGCVVAEHCSGEERRERRFHTTLGVEVGAGGGFHQEVVIELGLVRFTDEAVTVPLQWHSAGRDRLFPTFEGELEVRREDLGSCLKLRGTYKAPLGPLGKFGDGIVGRRVARRSLSAFLEQVAGRLDGEVGRRMASVSWHPAPYPVALRELGAENYIG